MNKNELIEKLNMISQCYDEACVVRERINSIVPEDNYQRNVVVPEFPDVDGNLTSKHQLKSTIEHKGDGALSSAKLEYEKLIPLPKEPQAPKEASFKKPDKPKVMNIFSGLCIVSILISLFFFASLIFSNFSPEILWTVFVIIAIGVIFATLAGVCLIAYFVTLFFAKGKEWVALNKFNEDKEQAKEKYSEELKAHQEELEEYKQKEQAFLNEYLAWREVYLEHLSEEERISKQLEIDKKALINETEEKELAPVLARLNEVNDLTSEEYLPVIDKLISYIQSGRADSLKEAINLYEENLYKERQLQLEREIEERRKYEELLRIAAEQSRHEEQMRFLQEQEAQRQAEERYRQQEEERRYREEERRRQAEDERRRNEEMRAENRRKHEERVAMYREQNATQRQCMSCAHLMSCRVRRPNCPSYLPK